ncbi:MAG: CBS domain-containing protein [Candidatus Latescibacterota bacterium]
MNTTKQITKIQELIYEIQAHEGMTKDVIVVYSTMSMCELGNIFLTRRISGLPVMDQAGIAGFISIRDYIKWLVNREEDCLITHKMSKKIKTVFDYSPLVEVLRKFEKYMFHCFPVIDGNLKLAGIITKGDIIRCILQKMEVDSLEEDVHTYRASHFFEDIIADKTTLKFQYTIKGKDFKRAGDCAANLKKTMKRLGFRAQVIRRVTIAVYEAEMNMIVFADEGEILAEVEQKKIKIIARDKGPGIEDIEKAMLPGYSTAPEWVRELGFGAGMGLYNINKCSDELQIRSDIGKGTELEIHIYSPSDTV